MSIETTASAHPRTWTFTQHNSGERIPVTCMPDCTIDHRDTIATPTDPIDVYCWSDTEASPATVPVDPNTGKPENFQLLSNRIVTEPFSTNIARRLPHAVIEIIDEHYIAPLDPDALADLINLLASRVDALRLTHAELVRTRAEYIECSGGAA